MSQVQTQIPLEPNFIDVIVFKQIDESFTFDLFVENFFSNDPSWISKEVYIEEQSSDMLEVSEK